MVVVLLRSRCIAFTRAVPKNRNNIAFLNFLCFISIVKLPSIINKSNYFQNNTPFYLKI